jgi:hypothetical protein
MRTDDLIRGLVADAGAHETPIDLQWWRWLLFGFVVAALGFFLVLGLRSDIVQVRADPRFLFKFVSTLSLGVPALFLARRAVRPEASLPLAWLLLAPLVMAGAIIVELISVPSLQWMTRLVGSNAIVCLVSIPMLSLPLLMAGLMVLRSGAPTNPKLAGLIVGLMAGGFGATLYAAHCTDDSPLFGMTWYTLAIAIVALIGTAAGQRLLKW